MEKLEILSLHKYTHKKNLPIAFFVMDMILPKELSILLKIWPLLWRDPPPHVLAICSVKLYPPNKPKQLNEIAQSKYLQPAFYKNVLALGKLRRMDVNCGT